MMPVLAGQMHARQPMTQLWCWNSWTQIGQFLWASLGKRSTHYINIMILNGSDIAICVCMGVLTFMMLGEATA